MPAETCERCHRPHAITMDEAHYTRSGKCPSRQLSGTVYAGVADARCAAARDAWLTAEVERLTAALAEAIPAMRDYAEMVAWPHSGHDPAVKWRAWIAKAEKACGVEV